MPDQIHIKRGDTFLLTCTYSVDGTPAALPTVRAQLRSRGGKLVAELTFTALQDVGMYTLSAGADETITWPVGVHECDIQYGDAPDATFSTPTFLVSVDQDITHD